MELILVPTDFSPAADNAVRYAVQIAKVMKANLLLCHAIKVPAEAPMAAQVVWPLEDYTAIKKDITSQLESSSQKFRREYNAISDVNSFHPHIAYTSEIGSVTDVVRNLVDQHHIHLVVMSMSVKVGVERLFLGSANRAMIDKAYFPVLLIPSIATFKSVAKIAFATDLNDGDIEKINLLARFARPFNAEVLLIHTCENSKQEKESQYRMNNFLNEVTNKINYPHIYSRFIKHMKVDEALDWFSKYGQAGILAMVHRKHDLLDRLFNVSHTQKAANTIDLPLLVLPA